MSTEGHDTPFDPYDPSTYPLPNLAERISNVAFRSVKASGSADIYQGTWTGPYGSMKVALKVVRVVNGRDKKMLRRFAREICVWNKLSHPNILSIHGLCLGPWVFPAMVSPWCNQGDINDYLRSVAGNPYIDEIRLSLLIHVVHGLAYLHEKNIIHADIKGGNILISDDRVALLCDFGLSIITADHTQSFTSTKGTLRWMAPELHFDDNPTYSVESDIWAFGCLCVEVFTGRVPYYKLRDSQVLQAVGRQETPFQDVIEDSLTSHMISSCFQNPCWARPAVNTLQAVLQLQLLSTTLFSRVRGTYTAPPPTVAIETEIALETLQNDVLFNLQDTEDLISAYYGVLRHSASAGSTLLDAWATWRMELVAYVETLAVPAQVGSALNHPMCVNSVAYIPTGERIVTGCDDGAIRVWDVRTRGLVGAPMTGHSSSVESLAVSLDGSQVASGSNDTTIRMWNVKTGAETGCLEGHTNYVYSVAFSPDGAQLVSGSYDKTIRVWDIISRKTIVGPIQGHTSGVYSVAYSPDGLQIISSSWDRSICIWNAATGDKLRQTNASSPVLSVAYSPDGRRVVAGCGDGSVLILDPETGAVRRSLATQTLTVWSVAFSPDGTKLATASEDCTIRLWDTETGQELDVLRGHRGGVLSIAFSPDGEQVISASEDSTVRTWDATGAWNLSKPK